jgi:hypothetical protein
MKYVIDSSIGVKWVVPEVDSAKALRLCDDYRNGVIELRTASCYFGMAWDGCHIDSPLGSSEPSGSCAGHQVVN